MPLNGGGVRARTQFAISGATPPPYFSENVDSRKLTDEEAKEVLRNGCSGGATVV